MSGDRREERLSVKTHDRQVVEGTNQEDAEDTWPARNTHLLVCYGKQL